MGRKSEHGFGHEGANSGLAASLDPDQIGVRQLMKVVRNGRSDTVNAGDVAANFSRRPSLDAAILLDRGPSAAAAGEEFKDVEPGGITEGLEDANLHFVVHRNDYRRYFDETRNVFLQSRPGSLIPMKELGFVGLGVMGAPMAGHLVKAGSHVTVWNRTPAKTIALSQIGATVAPSLEELAAKADAILLCVTRSEDVRDLAGQIAKVAKRGTLIIDHSTIAPHAAKELHEELRGGGLRFVDAPVTGGSMGAQKGQLTIFLGGDEADVADALEIVQPYAKDARRVGGPGQGQTMKLANQIAVGGALMGLCETLAFAKKAGLDLELTKDMIGGGAGGSWAFQNYGPKILAEDWTPGFSVLNQRKDFGYCRQAAAEIGAQIPGTEVVDGLLAHLQEAGHGDWTTAALYAVLLGSV